MKKADKAWWKLHKAMKLPDDVIRAKITAALKLEYMIPELIDVFRYYFTYKLINPVNKSESFHRVEYLIFMDEAVIDWEKSED